MSGTITSHVIAARSHLKAIADLLRTKNGSSADLAFPDGFTGIIENLVKTADANATAGDMLNGKTAYVNGIKVTGNIPSKAAETFFVRSGASLSSGQEIAAQQYLSGKQVIRPLVEHTINVDMLAKENYSLPNHYVSDLFVYLRTSICPYGQWWICKITNEYDEISDFTIGVDGLAEGWNVKTHDGGGVPAADEICLQVRTGNSTGGTLNITRGQKLFGLKITVLSSYELAIYATQSLELTFTGNPSSDAKNEIRRTMIEDYFNLLPPGGLIDFDVIGQMVSEVLSDLGESVTLTKVRAMTGSGTIQTSSYNLPSGTCPSLTNGGISFGY